MSLSSLPDDPGVDLLADDARRAIGAHWMHRASAEVGVAAAFTSLLPRLEDVGAADVVRMLARKAIDDERRHGELCARVAARYLGAPVDVPEVSEAALPDFGTRDEEVEVALVVLGMCCINESIATGWIQRCWSVATSPLAIHANRVHLRDEIDHARLGWAHLASPALTPRVRSALRPRIAEAVRVNVAEWKKPDPHLPPGGFPAHGHPSAAESADAIDEAVREVVLPGLAHVGLQA